MKQWTGSLIVIALCSLLILKYGVIDQSLVQRSFRIPFSYNSSNYLYWKDDGFLPLAKTTRNYSEIISAASLVSNLFSPRNFSKEEFRSLQTWNHMKHLVERAHGLPQAMESIKEAQSAWGILMGSVEEEKQLLSTNGSAQREAKQKQCPYSIRRMNASRSSGNGFKLKIPCGMVQGSSITVIGTPGGILGNFRIDLTAAALPGEPDPPIILHYNVRLHGDKVSENHVIVQNTWTISQDWGAEERCPPSDSDDNKNVDDLKQCNENVGKVRKDDKWFLMSNNSRGLQFRRENASRPYFPFKQGCLAIATLRVGVEGIQMSVDGKHVTSFAYRESLEPWLVSEVRISGDIHLISVIASGLPTSEELNHVVDLEKLKSVPLPLHKTVDLFIGVFSTANNFKRRMAVRRTWMQYDVVRAGAAVVRFFVGLHKSQMVNEELWNEARTYGDVQLMPFVDYYTLIAWKTIAICIYGTDAVSAKYVMKTDDDSFVRVDEVLASLKNINTTHGLLFGNIDYEAQPHRDPDSKWYISSEEWQNNTYPPWAHGPGYVVSRDIAKTVYKKHKSGRLKMFKLEDVAMGIWIAEMKEEGMKVKYVKDERIYTEGCEAGYLVAHYQSPKDMLCLRERLLATQRAFCCGEA